MADDPLSPQMQQLAALARRLESDEQFMAWVLKQYRALEQLTPEALVRQLEATPEQVVRLALCKKPDLRSSQFESQLEQIAAYTQIPVDGLRAILKRIHQP
jgi:hypothetical protein